MTWEEQENTMCKAEELDVAGAQFGMRLVPGGAPEGLIELFSEDDETYFMKQRFNHVWLSDLIRVASDMKELLIQEGKWTVGYK